MHSSHQVQHSLSNFIWPQNQLFIHNICPPSQLRGNPRPCWETGPEHRVIAPAPPKFSGQLLGHSDYTTHAVGHIEQLTIQCAALSLPPRSTDGAATPNRPPCADIASMTCHVKHCKEVYSRGRESATCAMYCHSARLHCAFGCAAHTQGVMDGWGADAQHRITTVSTCGCRWMALTYT